MSSMPFPDRCAIGYFDASRDYSSFVPGLTRLYVELRLFG
jgi:hypothetical protein